MPRLMATLDLWNALDLGAWYHTAPWAIDSLVYLVVFVGIARVTLGSRFEGRGGTAITAGVGIALAVGATLTARQAGFSLIELGPLAWLMLLLVLGLTLFDLLRRCGLTALPACGISLIVIWITAATLGDALSDWLSVLGVGFGVGALGGLGLLTLAIWAALKIGTRPTASREPSHATANLLPPKAIAESQAGIFELLRRLGAILAREGCTPAAAALLAHVSSKQRDVGRAYQAVLRQLAASGWRASKSQQAISKQVRTLLAASQENIAQFSRALEIAKAAIQARNTELALQAVQRLLALESDAVRLAKQLDAVLTRIAGRPGK